ncbi:MAG: heptosyltransferase [Pseudomonadota bacterium]|nr:heptosyltransferase [Pseudomonadota bacterium]
MSIPPSPQKHECQRHECQPQECHRFLVVRTDFLGDSVLTSVFIRMLSQIPNVTIDIVCFEYNFAAFKYNPHVEVVYWLYKNPADNEGKVHNQRQLETIQNCSYSAVFMLNRDLKSYYLLKYVSTKKIFGHRLGVRSLRSKMFCIFTQLTGKYHYLAYDDSIHEVINQANLLYFGLSRLNIRGVDSIAVDPTCYFYTESFNPECDIVKIDQKTNDMNDFNKIRDGIRDKNKVVVNISGRRDTVRYIPSALAKCIIEDLLKLNMEVLVVATKDDESRALELLQEISSSRVTLCTENDLFSVCNLMITSLYYIGADGGLLHIAAGLHMKCVGLFHAQNILAWHPWSKTQICLQTPTRKIYDLTSRQIIDGLEKVKNIETEF